MIAVPTQRMQGMNPFSLLPKPIYLKLVKYYLTLEVELLSLNIMGNAHLLDLDKQAHSLTMGNWILSQPSIGLEK